MGLKRRSHVKPESKTKTSDYEKKKRAFIRKHRDLFWYTPESEKENISDEFLLEHIINYADIPSIKELIKIMGFENAHRIFKSYTGRKKGNIYPEFYSLFSHYFEKFA
jgi:hypothetical protein